MNGKKKAGRTLKEIRDKYALEQNMRDEETPEAVAESASSGKEKSSLPVIAIVGRPDRKSVV